MSKITIVTMAVVLASGSLLAQRGPRGQRGPQADGERPQRQEQQSLKDAIGLSDEQLAEVNELRRANGEEIRGIFQTTRENALKLRTEMQKDDPDPAVVGRLMVDSRKTGLKVSAARDGLGEKVRGVLTEEQAAKLDGLAGDPSSRRALIQARGLGLVESPERGRQGFGQRGGPGFGGPGAFGFRGGPGFRGGQGFQGGRGFRGGQSFRGGPGFGNSRGREGFRGRGNDRRGQRDRGRRGPERFRDRGWR